METTWGTDQLLSMNRLYRAVPFPIFFLHTNSGCDIFKKEIFKVPVYLLLRIYQNGKHHTLVLKYEVHNLSDFSSGKGIRNCFVSKKRFFKNGTKNGTQNSDGNPNPLKFNGDQYLEVKISIKPQNCVLAGTVQLKDNILCYSKVLCTFTFVFGRYTTFFFIFSGTTRFRDYYYYLKIIFYGILYLYLL